MTFLGQQPPWFAFVVHPRDVADFKTMPGASLLREYSDSDEEFVRKASTGRPVVLSDVTFGMSPVRGELIGTPRMAESVLAEDGRRLVLEAVEVAAERGAHVVGLGALTAPATAGGEALLDSLPAGMVLTNGNGYTAAVARANVVEAADALGLGTAARVAVLGATGSVGLAASELLAEDGFDLVLVGPAMRRTRRLAEELTGRPVAAVGPQALSDADVVLVLTNHATAKVLPEMVKPGSVVIDVAQPPNVLDEEVPAFAARGVAVERGAIVRIPSFSCAQDFRLPDPRDCFACLAETYLLAREGVPDHSVGRPTAEYARRMERMAARHGVVARSLDLDAASPQPQPTI